MELISITFIWSLNFLDVYSWSMNYGLATDIEENGYQCKNIPYKVGSRGHLTPENRSRLSILHKLCSPKVKFAKFCQNICKTSLLCSYAIYLSRNDPWTGAEYLMPVKQWITYETLFFSTLYLHICVKTNSSAWAAVTWLRHKPTSWSECNCLSFIVSLFLFSKINWFFLFKSYRLTYLFLKLLQKMATQFYFKL